VLEEWYLALSLIITLEDGAGNKADNCLTALKTSYQTSDLVSDYFFIRFNPRHTP
jgi:hypothetical protein